MWLATVTCAELTRAPGVAANVELSLSGDSVVVVGGALRLTPAATLNGQPLSRARFLLSSSDSGVIAVSGDSLLALRRGTAVVTIRLASALLGDDPPSLTRAFSGVVADVLSDSTAVGFEALGDTATLAARAVDADGATIAGVEPDWSSSNDSVVTVSRTGRLVAVGVGAALVTARVDRATAVVSVTVEQELERYTFGGPSVLVDALGAQVQLQVQARDGRNNPIPNLPPALSIGDATVATISQAGLLTTLRNGSTWVYATRDDVTDSVGVTVDQRSVLLAITEPNAPFTSIGETRQLTARAFDRRGVEIQDAVPAWFTLDPLRVRVSEGLVTTLGAGIARVVAALDASIDTTTLTISDDVVDVIVDPDTAYATSLDDTLQFAAQGFNALGNAAATSLTWASPESLTIVRLLPDGRAIARGVGVARVIARSGTRADTGIAIVTNAPASITFTQDNRSLIALQQVDTPAVQIRNARTVLLGRGSVTWTSDDAAIARVSAVGHVTAVDTGSTYVRATAGAITDSILYAVENRPASIVIQGRAVDTLTGLGQALVLRTDVRNSRGVVINDAAVNWRSTDRTVIDTVSNDSAVAIGFGRDTLIAQASSGVADTVVVVVVNPTRVYVDNAIVASPRVGTLARPYARIQDAVDAADANDTVVVRRGTGSYSETVALTRRLFLLGDSTAFTTTANPASLPLLAHDTGLAGITIYTSAPQTIRFLRIRHTLDGPAIDANGSDVKLQYIYVNPQGTVTSRIGRGVSIANSPSGTSLTTVVVDSVRGYGVRLDNVSNAVLRSVVAIGVDSFLADAGAGIAILGGSGTQVDSSLVRLANVGILATGGAASLRLDRSVFYRNTWGARLDGGSFAAINVIDVYDNDSAGVVNPLGAQVIVNNGWWGDALGPRRGADPTAAGDSAVGNVSFTPLRSAPLIAAATFATLRPIRGTGQNAATNTTLPIPFTVRAINADGFPVAGVSVTFTAATGGGNFAGQPSVTVTTDGSGLAKATFTAGPTAGVHNVSTSTAAGSGPNFFVNVAP